MKKIIGSCGLITVVAVLSAGCATVTTAAPAVSRLDRQDGLPEAVLVEAIFIRERLTAGNAAVAARNVIRLSGPSLPNDLARLVPSGSGCVAGNNIVTLTNKTKFVLTVSVNGIAIKFLDASGIVGYLSAGQTACITLDQGAHKHDVKVTAHLVSNAEAVELISVKQTIHLNVEERVLPLVVDYARLLSR